MPGPIADATLATGFVSSRAAPQPVAEAGNWDGARVVAQPPSLSSLLENAKEEMTFAHGERAEKKRASDRSVEWGGDSRVEKVQEIAAYLERMPDLDPAAVSAFADSLRAGERDPATILERARERFPDPSHAYLALAAAERSLREEGDEAGAEAVGVAVSRLLASEGESVRAGLNAAAAVAEAAGGAPREAATLRGAYRDLVGGESGPAAIYRRVVAEAGAEGFGPRLRFLTRAAGDDLAAAGPSVPPNRLRDLLEDLSTLRVVATAHERAETAGRRVGRVLGSEGPKPDAMVGALLPMLSDGPGAPGRATALPGALGIPRPRDDAAILLLRESRAVLSLLPIAVFASSEVRDAALSALSAATERHVEREEGG